MHFGTRAPKLSPRLMKWKETVLLFRKAEFITNILYSVCARLFPCVVIVLMMCSY